jgi:hypothetical protein
MLIKFKLTSSQASILSYILVLGTTLLLGGYLISARNLLDDFIPWLIKTDFDEDFFKSLFSH